MSVRLIERKSIVLQVGTEIVFLYLYISKLISLAKNSNCHHQRYLKLKMFQIFSNSIFSENILFINSKGPRTQYMGFHTAVKLAKN